MKVCCVGEAMIELCPTGTGDYQLGVAGDSFNTATYLARAGVEVEYLTRLGTDPMSTRILDAIQREGIGTELIQRIEGRTCGLYLIENDESGERVFTYWREHSPARDIFADGPLSLACDVFFLSGITLAVTRAGFSHMLTTVENLRKAGSRIVFDTNYRPALWTSTDEAREHYIAILPLCDMVLTTLEDDTELWECDSIDSCATMYRGLGVGEFVVKAPDLTSVAECGDQHVSQQAEAVTPIDTTGAGDSFNAGYLAIRLAGGDLRAALSAAQQLSAEVVQHRGAILSRA